MVRLICICLLISGCVGTNGQRTLNPIDAWQHLTPQEKAGWIAGGFFLLGANIIANSEGTTINQTCVSTQSIQTGCLDPRPIQ